MWAIEDDIQTENVTETTANNNEPAVQKILEFGATVRQVKALHQFIKNNGDLEIIRDYKWGVTEEHKLSEKTEGPLSSVQALKNEIAVQAPIFEAPPESLTVQFGFHPLLVNFKDNGLSQIADGSDAVQIAKPDINTTLRNIATKGWGEAAKDMWAAQSYCMSTFVHKKFKK